MFKKTIFAVAALIVGLHSMPPATANDAALYDKGFDPNAAFIRIVSSGESVLRIGSKRLQKGQNVSPYVAVDAGRIAVDIDGQESEIEAASGKFYTVVGLSKGHVIFLKDSIAISPAKSNLSFYNLTGDKSVDLFVMQAKANVISNLPSGQGKTVQLRAPLTLDFAANVDGQTEAAVSGVKLQRGGGTTLIAMRVNGAMTLKAIQNEIAK